MEVYGYLRSIPCGIQRAMCFRKFRSALTSHSQVPQSFLSLVSFPSLALPLLCALHKVPCQPTAPLLRHALRKFHSTWYPLHPEPACPPEPPAKEGPYKSVSVRIHPFSIAHSIGIAQCALPADGNALCSLEKALHLEHGENLTFPPCSPLSPECCKEPAARNAAS